MKHGKTEKYIETEEEMSGLLLEMGREGSVFTRLKDKQSYTDSQFKEILEILVEIEKLSSGIRKKGVEFSAYIQNKHPKTGKLPAYHLKTEEIDKFLYDDDELADVLEKEGLELNHSGEEAAQKEEGKENNARKVEPVEFYEARELEKFANKIEKFKLDIRDYEKKPPVDEKEKPKPLYSIAWEKEEEDLFSLKEILVAVIEAGRKGMTITRYKGLGEMNPIQLWETTMDPERRSVLKVNVDDAVVADEMFTVLMGDQVEPRRAFIEKFAREVKNLDV
ncbi:MAG: hypothetical protein HY350_03735, partial [Candidatus Omnitrophica bacterium]|nr:hypothetical protein [Candidatus Omnitrophota bacterium]